MLRGAEALRDVTPFRYRWFVPRTYLNIQHHCFRIQGTFSWLGWIIGFGSFASLMSYSFLNVLLSVCVRDHAVGDGWSIIITQ